jgi:uncharacterized membrane protein YkvA (DUF1232 family)
MSMLKRLKTWARALKRDVHALYLAGRDPRVPWHAKALAIVIAAYALSPIDLIPDFIPVVGYLDDLLIVPLGIWLVVRMIPPEVIAQLRQLASQAQDTPKSIAAAAVIVLIWLAMAAIAGVALWQRLAV